MNYSFSTVFITILACNISLFLLVIIFHNKKLLMNAGYKLLTIFTGLTLMRLLFPFELPISSNIYFPELLSWLVSGLRQPHITFFKWQLSIWNLFESIWIIGILVGILHYIWEWKYLHRIIVENGINVSNNKKYFILLNRICRRKKKENNFRIYEVPSITDPMICGLWNPHILMPTSMQITENELYYILCHETSHYFNHDLLFKLLVHMVCILYWWNPACRILKRQTDILLELRVDQELTAYNSSQKVDYLNCLLKVAKGSDHTGLSQTAIFFCSKNNSLFFTRFQFLLEEQNIKRRYLLNYSLLVLMSGIYLLSYFLIFEADYLPPEIAQTVDVPTAENTYLIENGDGTYDVIYDGIFIETTESLEYYPNDLKIIKKIKETTQNEE